MSSCIEKNLTSASGKVLVLLDMNGTIVYRAKKSVENYAPAFIHSVGTKMLYYYFRPGAKELVNFLLGHSKVSLAFYTSMRFTNALPAVKYLLEPSSISNPESIIYDASFTIPDPEGPNSWSTKRNLEHIWETEGKIGHGYSAMNTIMVDDTCFKMRNYPSNLILIKEFTEADVLSGDDSALSRLTEILCELLESNIMDVREHLPTFQLKLEVIR